MQNSGIRNGSRGLSAHNHRTDLHVTSAVWSVSRKKRAPQAPEQDARATLCHLICKSFDKRIKRSQDHFKVHQSASGAWSIHVSVNNNVSTLYCKLTSERTVRHRPGAFR